MNNVIKVIGCSLTDPTDVTDVGLPPQPEIDFLPGTIEGECERCGRAIEVEPPAVQKKAEDDEYELYCLICVADLVRIHGYEHCKITVAEQEQT